MSMLRVWPFVAPWLVGVCEPVWLSMVPPMVLPRDLPIMVDDRELPGGERGGHPLSHKQCSSAAPSKSNTPPHGSRR